jgi:hypothetical protein
MTYPFAYQAPYPHFTDYDAKDDLIYGDGFLRMQTNAAWYGIFQFTMQNIPYSIAGWTLQGLAQKVNVPIRNVDLSTRMALMTDSSKLKITLSEDDTFLLGVGRIQFEVLRMDPLPQRPILRFYIQNYEGIA